MYCHPLTKEPLRYEGEFLVGVESGVRFPIENGLPIFVTGDDLAGLNGRYEQLYNRMAPFYDFFQRVGYRFMGLGGERAARGEYLQELQVRNGDRVLETSVGTGGNLQFLPTGAHYWGLDISRGMLAVCRRRVKRLGIKAELCLGAAEHLPYPDGSFDVVYHMGGINFFSDKASAIHEMVRVAKPGAKILIADETAELGRSAQKVPVAAAFYGNPDDYYDAPVHLLPPGMTDIQVKMISGGRLYCLTFRKPEASTGDR